MTTVAAPAGGLRGLPGSEGTAFLGVPYASAARFTAPEPLTWDGVKDATRRGPIAPQPPSRLERVVGPGSGLPQDEDCLSLNVWTPGGEGLPVLVWLHGGAFTSGSGADDWYDGALLAARGRMIVVTVGYRLGALGYLYLSPGFGPANLGLLDQLAALRWVRENIAAFGGDPERVTLAGQSAGAMSALALMGHAAAPDLFRQVVLQSLPAGVPPYDTARAAEIGRLYLKVLGLGPGAEARLRTLPVADLLAAQTELARRTRRPGEVTPPFQLVAAGGVRADLVGGAPPEIPMLIGTTRDEAWAFFPGAPPEPTERLFTEGSMRLAAAARAAHVYRFDWCPDGSPYGACHCIELPFVFGRLAAWREAPMLAGADPEVMRRLVGEVQTAWAAFVHGGSPGWPPYDHVRRFTGTAGS
jgi:para-nitrobenzyl esterase